VRQKISISTLAAMPPGPFTLRDSEVTGFVARRQRSALVTFWCFYRVADGTRRWSKIGYSDAWTPDQARVRAREIRRTTDSGLDPAQKRYDARHGPTMAELVDAYVADMDARKIGGKKPSTIRSDKSRISNHILPKFGKARATSITQDQVTAFMHESSTGSAKRNVILLSSIFSFGVKKKIVSVNPCTGIKKPADVRRVRRLSNLEYAQLWQAIGSASNATAASIITFLAISGWRSGEVKILKWSELDLPRQIANLGDTKSGKSVRPLSAEAVKLIKAQPRNGSEYVFVHKGKLTCH
jgi:integrase